MKCSSAFVVFALIAGITSQTSAEYCDDDKYNWVCGKRGDTYAFFYNKCRLLQYNASPEGGSGYTVANKDSCYEYNNNICKMIRCANSEVTPDDNDSDVMCVVNKCEKKVIKLGCQLTVLNCGLQNRRCGAYTFYKKGRCPTY